LIRIAIQIGKEGCLKALEADGHSLRGKAGTDIVCASASAFLQTIARLYYVEEGVILEGSAEREGHMSLYCVTLPPEKVERMKGMTDFLLLGLNDLKSDFPENIDVIIERESEEQYGT
jgi:uncharacterized protein YsxB (DUF464 family)